MLDWLNAKHSVDLGEEVAMSSRDTGAFQEALEVVESLPDYQQEDLIEIIRKRRLERRREALLEDIKEAQAEYERGECRTGTVEDLMREIDESSR
jgi:hypothetical protein